MPLAQAPDPSIEAEAQTLEAKLRPELSPPGAPVNPALAAVARAAAAASGRPGRR